MTAKEMIRCKDCCYLVEGDNGAWICEACYYRSGAKDIHDITDDECALNADDAIWL